MSETVLYTRRDIETILARLTKEHPDHISYRDAQQLYNDSKGNRYANEMVATAIGLAIKPIPSSIGNDSNSLISTKAVTEAVWKEFKKINNYLDPFQEKDAITAREINLYRANFAANVMHDDPKVFWQDPAWQNNVSTWLAEQQKQWQRGNKQAADTWNSIANHFASHDTVIMDDTDLAKALAKYDPNKDRIYTRQELSHAPVASTPAEKLIYDSIQDALGNNKSAPRMQVGDAMIHRFSAINFKQDNKITQSEMDYLHETKAEPTPKGYKQFMKENKGRYQ